MKTISPEELSELVTNPPLLPTAFNLLIRTKEVETTTESGLVVMTKKQEDREQKGSAQGYVIAMGPTAYDELEGAPWCELGDLVLFERYAGTVPAVDGMDDGRLRVIRDEEVMAKWPRY